MLRSLGIAQKVLLGSLLVVLAAVGLLGGLWIYQSYFAFEQGSRQARADFVARQNRELVENVRRAAEFLEFNHRQLEQKVRQELVDQANRALSTAAALQKSLSAAPMAKQEAVLADLLRSLRFWGGRGYYFALDLAGVVKVYGPDRSLEGKSGLSITDGKGTFVTRRILKLVQEKGEGFISYVWPIPGQKTKRPKLSFVKFCKPLGWVIGVGVYLSDREDNLQAEVLAALGKAQYGKGGYLFAGTYEGVSLLGPSAGKNVLGTTDIKGKKVVVELIEAAKQGGGFVSYHMPPLKDQRSGLKVSYVTPLPFWKWYLGAGYYVEDLEKVIETNQQALSRQVKRTIINILVSMFFLALGALVTFRYLSRVVGREYRVFQRFFQRANTELVPIDINEVNSPVLRSLALAANEMVAARKKSQMEKEVMENQLRQSQKLEALGTLTGGIAHDFNNILQAISGYTHLILLNRDLSAQTGEYAKEIARAAQRAGDLVGRLMAFGRRAEPALTTLDLNPVIARSLKMLARTISPMIRLKENLESGLWPVSADAVQMEQVLVNLGANASDAMPEGGELTVSTRNLVLLADEAKRTGVLKPGSFVLLTVGDTGQGMDQATQARVFEPFFTTKEVGKGTGLGLSTVYGIVKAHGGWVDCDSRPGGGTVFRIYLPADPRTRPHESPAPEVEAEGPVAAAARTGKGETLLVVDDEPAILDIAAQGLGAAGYRVITADSGERALKVWERQGPEVSLVIMDLGMPGMGGRRCLEEIKALSPQARVLIASGYSLGKKEYEQLLAKGVEGFVQKPYKLKDLLTAVGRALGREGPAGGR